MIRDDIEIDPPDAEVVYGAFWYTTPFHKEERISCFVLMLRADDTSAEVPNVDESYIHRT